MKMKLKMKMKTITKIILLTIELLVGIGGGSALRRQRRLHQLEAPIRRVPEPVADSVKVALAQS